jgi:methenyltetrahydrofolate cyclohydrolase
MTTATVSWDHSLRSFVQQAGSSSPTPGGGSVAALVAALAASMISMVSNLSQGDKYAHAQPQITDAIRRMEASIQECEELLLADISSFNQYMNALKLPKNTDEEKFARKQAINEAVRSAIDVPLRLVEVCLRGLQCTRAIAEASNKNVISDLGIGAILFESAAQSALLTIEINLASMKDTELKRQYSERVSLLIREIEGLKCEVLYVTRDRISG